MAPDETIETVQESKQVAYIPCSQAPAIGTLIPINMAAPAQAAFARFTQTHGNIDDYLVAKLRYDDRADLYQYFSVTTRVEGKG